MTSIHIFFCIITIIDASSFATFSLCVFFIYFAVGFVDTMAEGMTAMITKMDARIQELTPPESRKVADSESKAIGFFFMFRLFIRTLSMFVGGILANNKVNIKVTYMILVISPGLMMIYTLFFFKEARVNPFNFARSFNFLETKNVERMP